MTSEIMEVNHRPSGKTTVIGWMGWWKMEALLDILKV